METPEQHLKVLLMIGMRASTLKRLMVKPDLLNGDLDHMIRITSKFDDVEYSAGKEVSAMAEETPEISGMEDTKIPNGRHRGNLSFSLLSLSLDTMSVIWIRVVGQTASIVEARTTLSSYAMSCMSKSARVRQCLLRFRKQKSWTEKIITCARDRGVVTFPPLRLSWRQKRSSSHRRR